MIEITAQEKAYVKQLDERQQRLYLGLRAKLLGWHGVSWVSQAFEVDVKTVRISHELAPKLGKVSRYQVRQLLRFRG